MAASPPGPALPCPAQPCPALPGPARPCLVIVVVVMIIDHISAVIIITTITVFMIGPAWPCLALPAGCTASAADAMSSGDTAGAGVFGGAGLTELAARRGARRGSRGRLSSSHFAKSQSEGLKSLVQIHRMIRQTIVEP